MTGRAPGKYNGQLGGGFHGGRLNRVVLANAAEAEILATLDSTPGHYGRGRRHGEHLGDSAVRAGFAAVAAGRDFNLRRAPALNAGAAARQA